MTPAAGWQDELAAIRRLTWRQVASRGSRRLKFRFLYPALGARLYPAVALVPSTINPPPGAQHLHEYGVHLSARPEGSRRPGSDRRPHAGWEPEAGEHERYHAATLARENRTAFLNVERAAPGSAVDWQECPDGDKLWTFQLHYFDYANDWIKAWALTGSESWGRCFLERAASWMAENPPGRVNAWEPYPISRRLMAWCRAVGAWKECPWFAPALPELAGSIRRQACFLRRNLEYDSDNNHLLANAVALAWAGLTLPDLPGMARLGADGLAMTWRQLRRQVNPDGGHYENSTSYHMQVLLDVAETALFARDARTEVPADVWSLLERMFDFLAAVCRPDGEAPLLNDAVRGYPCPPADLLALGGVLYDRPDLVALARGAGREYVLWLLGAHGLDRYERLAAERRAEGGGRKRKDRWPAELGRPELQLFPQTGYAVLRTGWTEQDAYVCLDGGPVGPPHCAGHAHADSLAMEYYAGGEAVVTDSGVFEYRAGPRRDFFRSTAAHSTVEVDGVNSTTFCGAFRVGRPAAASFTEADAQSAVPWVEARHTGYRRLAAPVEHRRRVALDSGGRLTVADTLEGSGERDVAARLTLGPTIEQFELLGPHRCRLVGRNHWLVTVEAPEQLRLEIEEGREAREWKRDVPRWVLVLRGRVRLPVAWRLSLAPTHAGDATADNIPSHRHAGEALRREAPVPASTTAGHS